MVCYSFTLQMMIEDESTCLILPTSSVHAGPDLDCCYILYAICIHKQVMYTFIILLQLFFLVTSIFSSDCIIYKMNFLPSILRPAIVCLCCYKQTLGSR